MRCVIFGGTTEGRTLSHRLAQLGADVTVCVATAYGREEQGAAPGIRVFTGRLDEDGMTRTVSGADICVDATHPYAAEASRNIRAACGRTGTKLLRLLREKAGFRRVRGYLPMPLTRRPGLRTPAEMFCWRQARRNWEPSRHWEGNGFIPEYCLHRKASPAVRRQVFPEAISWPCKGRLRRS